VPDASTASSPEPSLNNSVNSQVVTAAAITAGPPCPFPHDDSIPDSQPCEAKFLGMIILDQTDRPRSNACVDAIKTLATKRTRAPYRHGVAKHVSVVISCGNGCAFARPLPSLRQSSPPGSPPKSLRTPLVQIVTVGTVALTWAAGLL
jgi:hypothetical protein